MRFAELLSPSPFDTVAAAAEGDAPVVAGMMASGVWR
jgi:hypothetical protein